MEWKKAGERIKGLGGICCKTAIRPAYNRFSLLSLRNEQDKCKGWEGKFGDASSRDTPVKHMLNNYIILKKITFAYFATVCISFWYHSLGKISQTNEGLTQQQTSGQVFW